MPAMKDSTGKVIGTMDVGKGCTLFACQKSQGQRMRLGCETKRSLTYDEALLDQKGEALSDSALAHRILKACAGTLDISDLGFVVEMLRDADKLSQGEAEAIMTSLDPDAASQEEMATDHCLAMDDRSVMVRRQQQFRAGLRSRESLRLPLPSQIRQAFAGPEFPHADRLK